MFDSGVDISLPVKVNRRLHLGVDKTFVSGVDRCFHLGIDDRCLYLEVDAFVPGGIEVLVFGYRHVYL